MELNRHYSQLLGLGDEWKVSDVMLSMGAKRVDIYVEYAAKSAQCPHCGKLLGVLDTGRAFGLKEAFSYFWKSRDRQFAEAHFMRPDFVRVGSAL